MVLTLFIKVKLTESNHNSLSASINSTNASRLSNNSFETLLLWNKYNTYTLLKHSYDCSVQFIEYLHGFHDQLGWDTTNLENRTMTLGTVNLKHIAYNKKKNYMIAFKKCVYTKLIIVKYKNNIILTSNTNDNSSNDLNQALTPQINPEDKNFPPQQSKSGGISEKCEPICNNIWENAMKIAVVISVISLLFTIIAAICIGTVLNDRIKELETNPNGMSKLSAFPIIRN